MPRPSCYSSPWRFQALTGRLPVRATATRVAEQSLGRAWARTLLCSMGAAPPATWRGAAGTTQNGRAAGRGRGEISGGGGSFKKKKKKTADQLTNTTKTYYLSECYSDPIDTFRFLHRE